MTHHRFTEGWTFRREAETEAVAVRLPHDAMLVEGRSPTAPSGAHGAHFLGGRYVYSKVWTRPSGSRTRSFELRFDGVYGDAVVTVNGTEVARNRSGYAEFFAPLDDALTDGENLIEVHVDNSLTPNSRWYTGSGIYRSVWLIENASVRFARDGVRFITESIGDPAIVRVEIDLDGDVPDGARVRVALASHRDTVVEQTLAADATNVVTLSVPAPSLWSHESPHLYKATVQVIDGDAVEAEEVLRVGLRSIEIDPQYGLRINGNEVLLQGACVHHDNGPLGAVTLRAAEYRRASILKQSGFNAIRSSHNPLSREFIEACDELGLYVIDELTDVWASPKTTHDSASFFDEVWRGEIDSMVAKDRNSASVIMYSTGNEIGETAKPEGVEIAERLGMYLREKDSERPQTIAVNFLLNVMASVNSSPFEQQQKAHAKVQANGGERAEPSGATSTAANIMANKVGSMMNLIARLPAAEKSTRDVFAMTDVAGYNYGASRYPSDARKHPERIVMGSETMPGDLARNWASVQKLPAVIGDFMWTGWDYLGEAGLGTWNYGKGATVMNQPYPHIVAGCGAIDITGLPGAPILLAKAVWGRTASPAIAVRPLDQTGKPVAKSAWRASDAMESWSWGERAGTRAEVEVYSSADEIELILNGRTVGRRRAGQRHGFLARFRVPYEEGTLEAVARSGGEEVGRSKLVSASGTRSLRLTTDRSHLLADGDDLAFVAVEIMGENGVVDVAATDEVVVRVDGAGSLAAFASAAPKTTRSYLDSAHDTYYGRALAIVRSVEAEGSVRVTAESARFGSATLELAVSAESVGIAG